MKLVPEFLSGHGDVVRVEVAAAKGSTPREQGAYMLVSKTASHGTIGGGRLELDAISAARQLLTSADLRAQMQIALGPQIDQCCGGHVSLNFVKLGQIERETMNEAVAKGSDQMPQVMVFGAGHVGRALALALAPLPFRVHLIDSRPHALQPTIHGVSSRAFPLPEQIVREAQPGTSFVVMTHEHSIDFLIINEALKRNDAAYVGLIGSKTKKTLFRSQFLAEGGTLADFAKLVCPIGANPTHDKRPEVIAAFVAAELCITLLAPKS